MGPKPSIHYISVEALRHIPKLLLILRPLLYWNPLDPDFWEFVGRLVDHATSAPVGSKRNGGFAGFRGAVGLKVFLA